MVKDIELQKTDLGVLNFAMEDQRVMLIQDASKQVCSSAIKWVLHSLFLKPGDLLVLLGVLHTPEPVKGTKKLLRYSTKVNSSSKFAANYKFVDMEAARKKEIENNAEILEISKLCKAKKVEFRIEVTSGASPAIVAMQSAQYMKATWVILDRKMKKNKKIFLEKLSCGISRIKKNNGIKLLRGPKTNFFISYDDMMPGNPEDDDLFSIELFPTCRSEVNQTRLQAEETYDKGVSTLEHIVESKPSISKFTHNCVKIVELQENCYEDEDVTSEMKSTSFSGNLWRSQSVGISSSVDGKSYKWKRAIRTGSSSQMHYGEMLN